MAGIPRTPRPSGFRISRRLTLGIAIISFLLGILGLVFGSEILWNVDWVSGLGAALLSLGLVTFVSEFYLRSVFTYELIEIVELRDHVLISGFTEAVLEPDIDWTPTYVSKRFEILMPFPSAWLQREWPLILRAAKKNDVDVRIYLLDADDDSLMAFGSAASGEPIEQFRAAVDSAAKRIARSWTASKKVAGSAITVYRLTKPITYSISAFDSSVAFTLLPGSISESPNLVSRFLSDSDQHISSWAHSVLADAQAAGYDLYFEDRPTPPIRSTSSSNPSGEDE